MSTLYGTLIAAVAKEYEQQTSALHKNTALINRFGEAMKEFGLTPDVKVRSGGAIALVALSRRGENHEAILAALADRGYRVDTPVKPQYQFTDGYTIWHAKVAGNSMEFGLLFYTALDVA